VAYIGLSLLWINAAGAAEFGSATMRGSRAYETTPSFQVFPATPAYPAYQPRRAARDRSPSRRRRAGLLPVRGDV